LHPADLPAVFGAGVSWGSSLFGVLALIVVGLAMTTVMQSSTAAIAVTLSAQFAGAVGLDQACALIIGQNIGTATSSAMAAIGSSFTAKRLARVHFVQADRSLDRAGALSGHHSSARSCFENH
jgi:phosphate:Na+ symporter